MNKDVIAIYKAFCCNSQCLYISRKVYKIYKTKCWLVLRKRKNFLTYALDPIKLKATESELFSTAASIC